jgi:hypothetical protein
MAHARSQHPIAPLTPEDRRCIRAVCPRSGNQAHPSTASTTSVISPGIRGISAKTRRTAVAPSLARSAERR